MHWPVTNHLSRGNPANDCRNTRAPDIGGPDPGHPALYCDPEDEQEMLAEGLTTARRASSHIPVFLFFLNQNTAFPLPPSCSSGFRTLSRSRRRGARSPSRRPSLFRRLSSSS